jgi:hypothetical protein
MDILKTLRELYEEKRRLDAIIASLEANKNGPAAKSAGRRGRKSMSPQERLKVSRRMTKYWENRRAQAQSSLAHKGPRSAETGERSKSTNAG